MQLKYPKEQYPKISVIMAVYNRASLIEKAILSFLDQDYPNVEFLVLDAGSADGSLDIIEKYKDHITYFRSHKDKGPSDAWNEGVKHSKGDLICFLNTDDYYEPDTLIRVGEAFIENPDVDIINVRGRAVSIDKHGNTVKGHEISQEAMHISKGKVNALHPNCRFFTKGIFDKYGYFYYEIEGVMALASDYEFIVRISLYNPVNITLDFVGYNYLGHEDSLTFNTNKYTKLRLYEQKVYYVEQLFKNHSAVMDDKIKKQLLREYRIAFQRRVVKNFVDKDYKTAWKNLKLGMEKFGLRFVFKTIRYYTSYTFRFGRMFRNLRKRLRAKQ